MVDIDSHLYIPRHDPPRILGLGLWYADIIPAVDTTSNVSIQRGCFNRFWFGSLRYPT